MWRDSPKEAAGRKTCAKADPAGVDLMVLLGVESHQNIEH